jgi:rhodanese-related sulfurtransferase
LYLSHCGRCHGEDGDATDYYHVIPLAGIGRRPPLGLVGRFQEESFTARGIRFSGTEAIALKNHLFQLQGAKGFNDPGWLWSPYLLSRKFALVKQCRILDVRDREDYLSAHIPNAVSVPLGEDQQVRALSISTIEEVFQEQGIEEMTQLIVYDRDGGPGAAYLWSQFMDAGHSYVAVLDGGWLNWLAQGFPTSEQTPGFTPSEYQLEPRPQNRASFSEDAVGLVEWDWHELTGRDGLVDAMSAVVYLESIGIGRDGTYLVQGTFKELSFLRLVLHLQGRRTLIQLADANRFLLHLEERH